jgi:hypothetical protein
MKILLRLLGVADEEAAIAAVTSFNQFAQSVQQTLGMSSFSECMAVISANHDAVKTIEELTGKKGPEAIGVLTAWKSAGDRATAAEAKVQAIEKLGEDNAAKALIDKLIEDKRLAPAARESAEKMYADYGSGALTAYADSLPGAQMNPDINPPTDPQAGNDKLTATEKKIGKLLNLDKKFLIESRGIETDTVGGQTTFELSA